MGKKERHKDSLLPTVKTSEYKRNRIFVEHAILVPDYWFHGPFIQFCGYSASTSIDLGHGYKQSIPVSFRQRNIDILKLSFNSTQ